MKDTKATKKRIKIRFTHESQRMEAAEGMTPLSFESPMNKLLTVEQVADILNCSVSNCYALMDQGKLPYVNIGLRKGRRVRPEDLEAFIEENRVESPALPTAVKHLA